MVSFAVFISIFTIFIKNFPVIFCCQNLSQGACILLVADNFGRAEGKHLFWSMRSCTIAVVTLRATPRAENIAYGDQE
jgi:hypothetical protein